MKAYGGESVHFAVISSMKFVLWVPTGKFYSSRQKCLHEFSSFAVIKIIQGHINTKENKVDG